MSYSIKPKVTKSLTALVYDLLVSQNLIFKGIKCPYMFSLYFLVSSILFLKVFVDFFLISLFFVVVLV